MSLKQLIFIIPIILMVKHFQCYAKEQQITSAGDTRSNQTISDGIFNCSYDNTINITKNAVLANGSYIYDNQTVIPTQLVGNYDYEILYNGNRRKVPQHKRACICQLKPCISLCSNTISETYQYVINNAMYEALDIFSIDVTLANNSVVRKNIAKDFAPIILEEYCKLSYVLSPETDEHFGWTLFENGTLLRHSDQVQFERTEYCFDLHMLTIDSFTYSLINPTICATYKSRLSSLEKYNYWAQVLSIMLLLLTIIGYFCQPVFLHLQGKLLITYASTLSLSFAIFSFINLSQITFQPVLCLVMGYLNHYFQLSHHTWLAIICYDIWRILTQIDIHKSSSYRKYAMYGYSLPFLWTLLTYCAQNLYISEALKPGISQDRCGLDVYKWSAVIYLYGPCLITLLFCLICIILTSRKIGINHHILYLHLLLMMVVFWFFEILSFVLHMFNMKTASGIIDYINSLQGVYLFITYITQRRVGNIIPKISRI
ncbi:probable G-protein coupled receptor Mth-like 11 [Calliphora vicina]|uniref:probable G-protein coupled receptor Mth-like 11 n=1 Tax=Calliphora vicina TaxID=7373 RepID=UPI00325B3660